MQQDAELHAEEDAKKKEVVDLKNTAEMIIFTAEKSIKDYGDKVTPEIKTEIDTKIANLKTAKEGNDIEAIKKATEELSNEMSKIGEAMSKANNTTQEAENKTPEEQEPEIKDAEVKEE
jgi:molecular chaperone DnaK